MQRKFPALYTERNRTVHVVGTPQLNEPIPMYGGRRGPRRESKAAYIKYQPPHGNCTLASLSRLQHNITSKHTFTGPTILSDVHQHATCAVQTSVAPRIRTSGVVWCPEFGPLPATVRRNVCDADELHSMIRSLVLLPQRVTQNSSISAGASSSPPPRCCIMLASCC